MKLPIFITGTDTGCGKTFFSSILLRALLNSGINAHYQKWVSTGDAKASEDAVSVYNFSKDLIPSYSPPPPDSLITPYVFKRPVSPHFASKIEKREIDPSVIQQSTLKLLSQSEVLLIEGVGGLLVPLTDDLLLIDLVKQLNMPVIIVARAGVGTINHTLLSIEALKSRSISIIGIVYNEVELTADDIIDENMRIITRFSNIPSLTKIPYFESLRPPYQHKHPDSAIDKLIQQMKHTIQIISQYGDKVT